MFKVMLLAKRKPGLTPEQYRRRYEQGHAPLGVTTVGTPLRRYVRNYVAHPEDTPEVDFDSVTEFWYSNRESYFAWKERYRSGPEGEILAADELEFMDRSTMRVVYVDEVEAVHGV